MKFKVFIRRKIYILVSCMMLGSSSFPVHVVKAKPSAIREEYLKKNISPFLDLIDKYFYRAVDTDKLFRETIEVADENTSPENVLRKIVLKLEDPYASFFTEEELNDFNTNMKGSFYGIGVSVSKAKNGEVLINEVFKNSPAFEVGLKKGDSILKVAGEDVTDMELQNVIKLIKGEKGTKVRIDIRRKRKELKFSVERREVILPSVSAKYYKKQGIGYLKVTEFLDNTDEEFSEKIEALTAKKVKGLVIDLRNNGGGYVDTAYNMLDRILPNNKVVYSYRYKNNLSEVYRTGLNMTKKDEIVDIPIVILTNKNSASASEIFSGALKDHGVAETFGEKTYGKGVAQSIFESYTGDLRGGIKFTILNYLLPLGESIHKKGIEPTVVVHNKKDKNGRLKDNQLTEALKYLQKKIIKD